MSANIGSLMYVGETPWHGLGTKYEVAPTNSREIIEGAKLNWEVNTVPMYTERHPSVYSYKAVYREDNNEVLGVINNPCPHLVQNVDTFDTFDSMLGKSVSIETAASLGEGDKIFGCFKLSQGYKIIDDDIDHYLVVINDHLKPDGKVMIINTPVRVVCQNTLSAALSSTLLKYRIPISTNKNVNGSLAEHILQTSEKGRVYLSNQAKKMLDVKVNKDQMEKILDELFPYTASPNDSVLYSRANEAVDIVRSQFVTDCCGADNLQNYQGTQYMIFMAMTDFTQHYFKNSDKSVDLKYRLSTIPGTNLSIDSKAAMVLKAIAVTKSICK